MGEERRGEFMKMLKGVSELELNVSLFPWNEIVFPPLVLILADTQLTVGIYLIFQYSPSLCPHYARPHLSMQIAGL
jgi:hypothetical protein